MPQRHPAGVSQVRVTAAVTKKEQEAWKRAAATLGVTVSDLVRDSVNYYLKARVEAAKPDAPPSRYVPPRDPLAKNVVTGGSASPAVELDAAAPPTSNRSLTAVALRVPVPPPLPKRR